MMNQHATAIEWQGIGMLFVGPAGCGKSSLAFELIEQGALLVADDQIILKQENGNWTATCPEAIRNKLHLRDIGLFHLSSRAEMRIDLIFQSDQPAAALSQPPEIGRPIVKMDFKMASAKQFIVNMLTLFDSLPAFP